MISYKTYRVNIFTSCTGCNKNLFSLQVLFKSYFTYYIFQKRFLVRKFTVTHITIGKHSVNRLYYFITESFKLFNIILHNGIMKHIMIHGWRYNFFTGTSHNRCCKHIISYSIGNFSDNICRSRSNHYNICLFCY